MKQAKWGIVGVGKLGTAILTQFDLNQMKAGIYHPDTVKAERMTKFYPYTWYLQKEDLASLDYLIIALPATKIVPFIKDCQSTGLTLQKPVMINMATTMSTEKVKQEFTDQTWLGMKFLGHSESLKNYGEGLFITEEREMEKEEYREVLHLFSKLGRVVADEESVVEKVNKLGTYHAIKAAREVELKMSEEGISDVYKEQVLRSVLPEVIRSYSKGNLGHFAHEIVRTLDGDRK